MPPLLELRLLVRYHGVKATQYFSKFTDDSVSVFRKDLVELGLPHPKTCNVALLSHGLVECFWPSARQGHALHTNLLVKTRVSPMFEQIIRSLSITSVAVKEKRINSWNLHNTNVVNLKRSHSQIDEAGRDEAMNATSHLRPHKVAKTEARGFDLHSKSDSSSLPDFRNAHNSSHETTQFGPRDASSAASHPFQRYPTSQVVKSSQPSSQPNGIRNANPGEQAVNDFLHRLSEDMVSSSSGLKKPTDTPSVALSKSAESLSNRGGSQSVTCSDSFPGEQKNTFQIPISNPEGAPGHLSMARPTILRNVPASHLPTPSSSAHFVNNNTAQNFQPLTEPSFSRSLKPTNSHATVSPAVSQHEAAMNASNRVQSSTMGVSPVKPYSTRTSTNPMSSYAKFDPATNTYTAVHYSSSSSSTSNPSSTGPRRRPAPSHNGSTSHEDYRSNVSPTATSSWSSLSTPPSRPPPYQRPGATPPTPAPKTTPQGVDPRRPLTVRTFSSLSANAPIQQRPVVTLPSGSLPWSPNLSPSAAAPTGNEAKKPSSLSADGGPKDVPHLTLIAQTLRQKIGALVKKHGEISDGLQRVGSAWVPEKLVVVETGSQGEERDRGHDDERNAEFGALKAKLAAVQQLAEAKEVKTRAETQRREEEAKAELDLLKTKLDAVQKVRTEEARVLADERIRTEVAETVGLEFLKRKLVASQEDAEMLVAERTGRRAENAELELLRTKLASVEKEREDVVKMLTEERRWRAEADKSLQQLRNEGAKMLAEEQKRRDEAENVVADVRRECRHPFVVPSLLDIFVDLSKLTTKGLRLTSSMNGTSGLGSPSLNSQSGVAAVSRVMGLTRTRTPIGNAMAETSRVKLEPLDTTL